MPISKDLSRSKNQRTEVDLTTKILHVTFATNCTNRTSRDIYKTVHAKEPEIGSLATKSVAQQKLRFHELKLRGNYYHNVRVLEEGVGELIVLRRPTARANIDDYLHCIHCLGFLLANDLFVHTKNVGTQ